MSYAAQQDMVERFGADELIQLTDRATPPSGAIDATVVSRALTDADAEINGYLAGRYTLPLLTVPTVLKRLACDMARYYLYDDHATEQVTQRYKDAVKFLMGVTRGDVKLDLDGANPVAGSVQLNASPRVFSREA